MINNLFLINSGRKKAEIPAFFLLLILLCSLLLLSGCASGNRHSGVTTPDELDIAIREASDMLNVSFPSGSKILILNLESNYFALSEYIIDKLFENAVNAVNNGFSVIDMDKSDLKLLRDEENYKISDFGRFSGAQFIVYCEVAEILDKYRMDVRVYKVETAQVVSSYYRSFAATERITALLRKSEGNTGNSAVASGTLPPLGFTATGISGTQANTAQRQTQPAQNSSAYFTGDGGGGKRITVMPFRGVGLSNEQQYLSSLVQGVLVQNINKYSAFSVLDRVSLEKVMAETESDIYAENPNIIQFANNTQADYIITGRIIKTPVNFTLEITVTNTHQNINEAFYSGNITIENLENFTGINLASLDLLDKLGIKLSDLSKRELSAAGSQRDVQSQIALAQGITAQRQGSQIAALGYFYQAAAYDPALSEASNRTFAMIENMSKGNIGQNIRNDIAWRREWVARLTETEEFLEKYFTTAGLWTLFYANDIQWGEVNYNDETVTLSIITHLQGSTVLLHPIEQIIQAITDALKATGRSKEWDLDRWPFVKVSQKLSVDRYNWYLMWEPKYTINFELLNGNNKVIGRNILQISDKLSFGQSIPGRLDYFCNDYRMSHRTDSFGNSRISQNFRKNVVFTGIKSSDITGNLTIRITSVNGQAPETAARNGLLHIKAITKVQWESYTAFDPILVRDGRIEGVCMTYNEKDFITRINEGDFIIIGDYFGEPITSIGDLVFQNGNIRVRRVTIPNSIISIGNNAFLGDFTAVYNNNNRRAGIYTNTNREGGRTDNWRFAGEGN
ncbi:MAG: hypothetical protein FWB86_10450 [Treponema sp.]|nr:hypothetical protein [Treponema sp.]MCL2251367.1 hypothetical protein [Treponema sp.]